MLSLPRELRSELKDPLGPVFEDADELLALVDGPLIAVGDVATFHLRRAGRVPDVAVIDGLTERDPVEEEVATVLDGEEPRLHVDNPPGDLTRELLEALVAAIDREGPVVVHVDGEEDLATLPAILAAPDGASVVYGQPGEGMVHVTVDAETTAFARELLGRMDGDSDAALALLSS